MPLADEDGLWRLDECEVTMLRGVAYVDGSACRIELNLDRAECVLTVGSEDEACVPCGGSGRVRLSISILRRFGTCLRCGGRGRVQPTVLTVPVSIEPSVREALRTSLQGTVFHVGKELRRRDTYGPEDWPEGR